MRWAATRDEARLLRGARRRPGRRRRGDEEGVPAPGARAAPRRQHARPRGRGEVQGGRRGLRGPLRSRAAQTYDAFGHEGLRSGGWAPAHRRLRELRGRPVGLLRSRRPPVQRAVRVRPRGPGGRRRRRGPGRARRSRRCSPGPPARSRSRRCPPASAAAATAPSPGRRSGPARRCGGSGELREVASTAFGQLVRAGACPTCGGDGRVAGDALRGVRRRRTDGPASAPGRSRFRRASSRASGSASPGPGHAGEPGRGAGDLYVRGRGRRGRALRARWPGPGLGGRASPRPGRCSAARSASRPWTASARSTSRRAPSPGEHVVLRGLGPARAAAARPAATSTWCSTCSCRPASARSSGSSPSSSTRRSGRQNRASATGGRRGVRRAARLIRLAVRCRPELAERVLAELVGLAPGRRRGGARARLRRVRDLRCAGRAARPAGPRGRRRARALVEVTSDRGARRLGRSLAGLPPAAAGRRPPLGAPVVGGAARPGRSTSSSIPARRSAPAPTRRPGCASSCSLELADAGAGGGPLTDLGTGSGVLAIAAAKLGLGPVVACDHEPAALEAAAANADGERGRARAGAGQPARRSRRPRLPRRSPTSPRRCSGELAPAGAPRPPSGSSARGCWSPRPTARRCASRAGAWLERERRPRATGRRSSVERGRRRRRDIPA